MTGSLRKRAEHGVLWSAVDAGAGRVAQFVVGVILARLLLPEQFGLLGMLAIFMAVAQAFVSSGFGVALVQKKEVTPADASSVFYLNVAAGLVLAGLLCLAAPWIASFYGQPILSPLTRAMSLMLVISSFGVVQGAMLTRNLAFKIQAKVSVVSVVGSGIIGVAMAYRGFGVWSLVAQQICGALFRVVLLWVFNGWRPGLVFSFAVLRHMFGFGSRMLASGLLNEVFRNLYSVVIGRLFSPADLGFYTRAKHMEELPSMTLVGVVGRVSLPVFSSVQDDDARVKRGLQKVLSFLVFVIAPTMVLLAVTASPLVTVVLTEKWLPSVPYLQLLCIQGALLPLHALNLNVLIAKGRSDLFLRLEMIKRVMTIGNLLVSWRWGITGIIIGQITLGVIAYFLNSYYTGKLLGYPARNQLRDVAGYFVSALVAGAAAYALRYAGFPNAILLLGGQVVLGAGVYLGLCGLLRLPGLAEGRRIVAERIPAVGRLLA